MNYLEPNLKDAIYSAIIFLILLGRKVVGMFGISLFTRIPKNGNGKFLTKDEHSLICAGIDKRITVFLETQKLRDEHFDGQISEILLRIDKGF